MTDTEKIEKIKEVLESDLGKSTLNCYRSTESMTRADINDDIEITAWMPLPKAYREKQSNKVGWSSLENVREKVERGTEE